MATDYCKYHPLSTAKWRCETCCIPVCDDCAPAGTDMESLPHCILCNQPLQPVLAGATVEPFWYRSTHFMRLPFSLPGLLILVLMMLLPVVAPDNLLPAMGGASYFLLALIGWMLLVQNSRGEVVFPGLQGVGASLSGAGLSLSLAVAVLFTALSMLADHMPLTGSMLTVLAAAVFPAALLVAATEKTLAAWGRSSAWQQVFSVLRFLYLPLSGASVLLLMLSQAMVGLLADVATPGILQGLRNGFYGYGLWVVFSVCGYCLYQFQEGFGFHSGSPKTRTRRTAVRRLDTNTAKLEVFLKEGMYDKALGLLKSLADRQRTSVEAQERYFQLLVFLKDREGVAMQGESYMAALLADGKNTEALIVLSKILLVMPDFRPEEPAVAYDLARACVELREFAKAASLLDGMHQMSPHFPLLPEAYMLRAKLLHEKLGQSAQALEVMEYLVGRFRKHPRFENMKSYWQQLGGKAQEEYYGE